MSKYGDITCQRCEKRTFLYHRHIWVSIIFLPLIIFTPFHVLVGFLLTTLLFIPPKKLKCTTCKAYTAIPPDTEQPEIEGGKIKQIWYKILNHPPPPENVTLYRPTWYKRPVGVLTICVISLTALGAFLDWADGEDSTPEAETPAEESAL